MWEAIMSVSANIATFLDANNIRYSITKHSLAYTANEVAAAAHVSGRNLAKTVVVVIDGTLAMVVVAAPEHLSLHRLQTFVGASSVALATESDFSGAFPGCELGAMPPLGPLYNIPVYVDESLVGCRLTFNGGTHRELITMEWADYEKLIKPIIGHFTTLAHSVGIAS